ncbi:hypothetical protein acdb102_24250 [Acidothermaceae bacterium B102]|nr:hypothetical protein acdb102_24250 [Acidothermaceae bacterium B102]
MRADGRCRRLVTAALTCVMLGATACGATPSLSATAAPVLQKDAAALSTAARAGDRTAIAAALAALRADVAHQRAAGHLSAARSIQILAAGDRVAADAPAPSPPSSSSPTPQPGVSRSTPSGTAGQVASPLVVPTTGHGGSGPATSPGRGKGNDKGKGKGKGRTGDG